MNDSRIVDDLLTLNIFLYNIDIVDENIIGELATRSVQKYDNSDGLLRCNIHICYLSNINAVFQSFHCPNCDTFSSRTVSLERHLTTCSERVRNIYPRNCLWQAGLFRYQVLESTKTFQKLSNNRLWIDLCPTGVLQRYKDNNVDRKACSHLGFNFLKSCGRTNFSLQLWSSPPRFIVYWNTESSSVARYSTNETFNHWFRDNSEEKAGQLLGETYPTS